MYIQPDFIIHRLAEKAAADASLAGQQPYKTASRGDQDWFGGAITKHCQGDDTDFKTLVAALLTAHEAITVDNTPGRVNPLFAKAQHPTLGRPVHDEGEPLRHPEPGPAGRRGGGRRRLLGQSTWSPGSARRDVLQRREHRPQSGQLLTSPS